MNDIEINYPAWAQVLVTFAALVLGSGAITSSFFKRYYTLRTLSIPSNPVREGIASTWSIEFRNKSSLFGGFTIYLFPYTTGNSVVKFQQTSLNDGGMVINPEIVDGALEIKVERFAKKRLLKFQVQFNRPDFPWFDAGALKVARKTKRVQAKLSRGASTQVILALVYQRLMLTLLVFVGVTVLIAISLLFGMYRYG